MAVADDAAHLTLAVRHARLRWIGAPLLFTGALLLAAAVMGLVGGGSVTTVMLGMLGAGTGLASFGANHDTALAHAREVRSHPGLPAALRAEVENDLAAHRTATLALRPSAVAGLLVPLVCILVQGAVFYRVFLG